MRSGAEFPTAELDDMAGKVRLVMGDDWHVAFGFMDEFLASISGKCRYIMVVVSA